MDEIEVRSFSVPHVLILRVSQPRYPGNMAMQGEKREMCEKLCKEDMPIEEFLKKAAELFPQKKERTMENYFVITAAELLDKLNEGSNVSFERGPEGTPSEEIPYYWVNVDGCKYPMYSMPSPRTEKYGICWDSCI